MGTALARCTPVILTWNEAPNLERCLASVRWAERVVVVDSGSTDDTEQIARSFPNVHWVVRPFDQHATQWTFAVERPEVAEVVVALDADMSVPAEFPEELECFLAGGHAAGEVSFEYRVHGRPLRGSLYPPQVRVFRRGAVTIRQDGHTQRFEATATPWRFRSRWIHDDRKPVDRWLRNQIAYSALEATRLWDQGTRTWVDHLRRLGLMPSVAGVYAWLRAGGPVGGAGALRYALERSVFEALLALRLLDYRAGNRPGDGERRA